MKARIIGIVAAVMLSTGAWAASINVNSASAEELMMLNGVGEVIAARIIEEREANGDFSNAEGMAERVDGLGEAFIRDNADDLTFSGGS